MSSPAVIALRCTVSDMERIDRGEILYAKYGSKGELPVLSRDGSGDKRAVVTAEAVTLYKGQEGMPVSVPIVVLGKTEVILKGTFQQLKLESSSSGFGMPGTPLYHKYDASSKMTLITDKQSGANFLGTVVHQASPTTYSVDLVVNFAK